MMDHVSTDENGILANNALGWGRRVVLVGVTIGGLLLPMAEASQAPTGGLPFARPETLGMSSERLRRIDTLMERCVADRQIPGAVTLVARRGRLVHLAAYGFADVKAGKAVRTDTLFRIASCTKPVTAVAVLQLVEEGKVRLSDPICRFIPELKAPRVVLTEPGTAEARLVPVEREVTIYDLLTHTSGLVSSEASAPWVEALRRSERSAETLADLIPRYGTVPLAFQPGTRWRYGGAGFNILARIVEIASGQRFDHYLKQHLFEPLGMKDTSFVLPPDRQSRLTALFRRGASGLEQTEPPVFGGPSLFPGSSGLLSSAGDYARFAHMLANGGQLSGRRLLGSRTVELMTADHVGEKLGTPGLGFGLSVAVVLDPIRARRQRSKGSYGWPGAFGTHWWVDPKERLVAVLMLQVSDPPFVTSLHRDFENAVMQAIID